MALRRAKTHKKVAVFNRTEQSCRPVRNNPNYLKIHRREPPRLEEIIGGSGTMDVCPFVSISSLIRIWTCTSRSKGLLGVLRKSNTVLVTISAAIGLCSGPVPITSIFGHLYFPPPNSSSSFEVVSSSFLTI